MKTALVPPEERHWSKLLVRRGRGLARKAAPVPSEAGHVGVDCVKAVRPWSAVLPWPGRGSATKAALVPRDVGHIRFDGIKALWLWSMAWA